MNLLYVVILLKLLKLIRFLVALDLGLLYTITKGLGNGAL